MFNQLFKISCRVRRIEQKKKICGIFCSLINNKTTYWKVSFSSIIYHQIVIIRYWIYKTNFFHIVAPTASKVWQYFEKIDNSGAKCSICSKLVTNCGNTSNYHKHLKSNHVIDLTGITKRELLVPQNEPARKKRKLLNSSPEIQTTPKSAQPKLMETINRQLSFRSNKRYFFIRYFY